MNSHRAECAVFWFRRDLRLEDNAGLFKALDSGLAVVPVFIFDSVILKKLPKNDSRVEFIHGVLGQLNEALGARGGALRVYHGEPLEVWPQIFKEFSVKQVFCNEDYEPYAITRDKAVARVVEKAGATFVTVKDHLIFAKDEVTKDDGLPYKVFTPYSRKWRAKYQTADVKPFASLKLLSRLQKLKPTDVISLTSLGFTKSAFEIPPLTLNAKKIEVYKDHRNFMGEDGTSRLGLHLRFGTISPRKLIPWAEKHSETFVTELIWREFFSQILFHFPYTVDQPFDPRYKKLEWRGDRGEFKKWCLGETGYPVVDAAMIQLNSTGFMHNRARMIVASFLCKHLLIDWTWGERYFAEKLLDFELASNVGNWQWAAGCGCDAAPYFRVFNPALQAKKFDPQGEYVRRWLPPGKRPPPMVDHEMARRRALSVYKKCLHGETR